MCTGIITVGLSRGIAYAGLNACIYYIGFNVLVNHIDTTETIRYDPKSIYLSNI